MDFVQYLVEFIKAVAQKYATTLRMAVVLDYSNGDATCPIPYVNIRYLDGGGEQARVLFFKRTGLKLPEKDDIVIVGHRSDDNPILIGFLETDKDTLSALSSGDVQIPFSSDEYIKYSNDVKITLIKSKTKIDGDTEITGKLKVDGGSKRAAREGDSVSVYVPGVGTCTGTITSGSDEVKIE
jgi:hypothetical protein